MNQGISVYDGHSCPRTAIGAMPKRGPRILINATEYATGARFVFTDERFTKELNSELSTYPISHAVMASAAFPGAFNNVTLRNFYAPHEKEERELYEHLFDGGPADNLGVLALLDTLQKLYGGREQTSRPRPCLLFIVDAYTFQPTTGSLSRYKRDTRGVIDRLVDLNALAASDAMLVRRRFDLLKQVGFSLRESYDVAFREFPIFPAGLGSSS